MYALLLWPPLSGGAHEGWPLSVTQLLVLVGLLFWFIEMLGAGRLQYRRTALDLSLALLILLVLLQIAVGNRALATWALAPPPADPAAPVDLPGPPFFLGSSLRNARKSASSNFFAGVNCHSTGPSRSPNSSTPEAKKRLIESPASASTRRLVAKRGPLTENTKPSGVSRDHLRNVSGFCEP